MEDFVNDNQTTYIQIKQQQDAWQHYEYEQKKEKVQAILIRIFMENLCMDIPKNFQKIVDFCTDNIQIYPFKDDEVISSLKKFLENE